MPKYTVGSPLRHDGKDYGIGDSVSMKAQQAEILLEQGVLDPVRASKPVEEMIVAELVEALGNLKVDIPQGSKKADLVELYVNAVSADEDADI